MACVCGKYVEATLRGFRIGYYGARAYFEDWEETGAAQ